MAGLKENRMDLISKEDVLDEIHRYMEERDYTIGSLHDKVCEMPSAEPERKTGKWIKLNDYNYRCSICGNTMMDEWNFCPDCGAKMEVEE